MFSGSPNERTGTETAIRGGIANPAAFKRVISDLILPGSCNFIVSSFWATSTATEDRKGARANLARVGVSVTLVAMAVLEGLWVTPKIASLHAGGAVRGVGEAGAALASAHSIAELLGKTQALLAIALIALHVATLPAPRSAP